MPPSASHDDRARAQSPGRETSFAPEGPFTLREGSPGGERYLYESSDPAAALIERDHLRSFGHRSRVYDVIGRDTDPPETGEVEWCESTACWTPVLASAHFCQRCLDIQQLEDDLVQWQREGFHAFDVDGTLVCANCVDPVEDLRVEIYPADDGDISDAKDGSDWELGEPVVRCDRCNEVLG